MQKSVKRTISILLSILMIAGVFAIVPFTASAEGGAFYVKVTSEPGDWSGDYLIVYEDEDGSTAFNGSSNELNSSGNYIDVTISNGKIASNAATDAAKVTIAQIDGGYSIATVGGTYIGGISGTNMLKSGNEAILNTISLENDSAQIVSNTSTLRFNTSWSGFRYYKTMSQKPVQLYKLTGGSAPTYTVTWKNWNGEVLETDAEVAKGTTPTYDGETPVKADDDDNTYTFAGWTPEVTEVTGEAEYTAQFTAVPKTYTVTWKNWNGEVLETDAEVAKGTTPAYDGETPVKADDDDNTYTFAGWTPEVTEVTGDAEYTATFNANPKPTIDPDVKNGIYEEDGKLYFYENGKKVKKGCVEINGDIYYFGMNYYALPDGEYYLPPEMMNGLLPSGNYLIIDAKVTIRQGIREEGGKLYYYDNNKKVKGAVDVDGDIYYFSAKYYALPDGRYYISADLMNGLLPAGTYCIKDYKILKEGLVTVDGKLYYCENYKNKAGAVQVGEDIYYFGANTYTTLADGSYYISANLMNGILPAGTYEIKDGKIHVKNGIYVEDGKTYYYRNSKKVKGAVDVDGDIYYFSAKYYALPDGKYYISADLMNGLLPAGSYNIVDGKIVVPNA